VWIDPGQWIPRELASFFASPPGNEFLHAMDAFMVRLRKTGAQPRRDRNAPQLYKMPREELLRQMNGFTNQFRAMFDARVLGRVHTTDALWHAVVSHAIGSETDPVKHEELIPAMAMRYEKPAAIVDGRRVDPYPVQEITPRSGPIVGWELLRTSKEGSVGTLLKDRLFGQNNEDHSAVYVVDGTNLFYKYDPAQWPAELMMDRNGEYGPVVIVMKHHMLKSKLLGWPEGGMYIYNALQEMHGGVRHKNQVLIVSIEVPSCDGVPGQKKSCIEYEKSAVAERRCRVVGEDGERLTEWEHAVCEYDDVAANSFFDQMRNEMNKKNEEDGGQRDAVIVTSEGAGKFLKDVDAMNFVDAAMMAMSDAINTRVYRLQPLPVQHRSGKKS
tara:strand:+ start:205 stop:1359 length:1155 start_codon:yes stop_codon:yes gene_type:complete